MLDKLFKFVADTCAEFGIDESHGLTHAIQVYRYGMEIYDQVLESKPQIDELYQVIVCGCVLHDMCDYKYMDEKVGVVRIVKLLNDLSITQCEINLIIQIITTMSYTKIKAHGFPKFETPNSTLGFNIVREADLLAAYDFDRSVVYAMECKGMEWTQANKETVRYFTSRVLTQIPDGLFTIPSALSVAIKLHKMAQHKLSLAKIF